MEKLTYQQAYDKIIQAYFRDEIKPMDSSFCFCGTLAPDHNWKHQSSNNYPYTSSEYFRMEHPLLSCGNKSDGWFKKMLNGNDYDGYEDDLFYGMCAALEVLKNIHRERGEDIDGVPAFTKRELKKETADF